MAVEAVEVVAEAAVAVMIIVGAGGCVCRPCRYVAHGACVMFVMPTSGPQTHWALEHHTLILFLKEGTIMK